VDDTPKSAPQPSSPASTPFSRPAAYALLAALVVIWGLNWPIMKLVVHAMPPLWFVITRYTIGAACLFAFLLATGRFAKPTRADWPAIISVSVFQMWLFIGLTTIGLQFVPAGRSAILSYTMPLWVFPAAVLFFGEKLTPWKLIGMALGLAGLIVLLNPASIDWADHRVVLGNFLLLLGAAMWAIAILHTRRHRWHLSPLQLAPFQMALLIVPACVDGRSVPGGMVVEADPDAAVQRTARHRLCLLGRGEHPACVALDHGVAVVSGGAGLGPGGLDPVAG
jgi:drug/metabolite transporter (DMT)-like permease